MARYFDAESVKQKVARLYERGKIQKALIDSDEGFFPLRIPLKKIGERTIKKDFATIQKEAEALMRSGLPCETKCFRFASIGEQTLPVAVRFDCRERLLSAIGKREDFARFAEQYVMIVSHYPRLKSLLSEKPLLVENHKGEWKQLLAICRFFLAHPSPDLYIRELSIEGVDTKFIEAHKKIIDLLLSALLDPKCYDAKITAFSGYGFERKYGLKYPQPLIRFRILDESLQIAGLDDLSLPIEQFGRLDIGTKKVFVIENKVTFLSFPLLPESIVLFGSGYGVHQLKLIQWLQKKEIIYWGDIDSHGFAILSLFRKAFPAVRSFMMDEETAEHFNSLGVKEPSGTSFSGEAAYLTENEQSLLEQIRDRAFRLEQERIPFDYVMKRLGEYC